MGEPVMSDADDGCGAERTIAASLSEALPTMVTQELTRLSAGQQQAFVERYRRSMKSARPAYFFWVFGLHYAYLRMWGMLAAYLLTVGGIFVWMAIDAFRMPRLVRDRNRELAIRLMRDLKAKSG